MKKKMIAGAGMVIISLCVAFAGKNISFEEESHIYKAAAVSVSDAYAGEQWALSNDGSFSMETGQNRFQVFEFPFEMPYAPFQWGGPEHGRRGRDSSDPNGRDRGGNTQHEIGPGYVQGDSTGSVFVKQSLDSYRLNDKADMDDLREQMLVIVHRSSSSSSDSAVAGIDINVEQAWNIYGEGKRDVIIALIDTGVDTSHEDLGEHIWVNSGEIPGNGVDDDGNGYVDDVYGWNFYDGNNQIFVGSDDDHGTHGAGTIAANSNNGIGITGIIRGNHIKLMILKVLGGEEGAGDADSLIDAIHYAESKGASICNLSLSSYYSDIELYDAMASSNMLFVIAAGNGDTMGIGENIDIIPSYPADFHLSNSIVVANLNYDGDLHYSSNYGPSSVDLAAPGSYILSTTSGNTYSYMTGTSMAAPMVTAAAAMLYSGTETLTLSQVKDAILNNVTRLDTLSGKVKTGGMLNLGAAMAAVAGY